MILMLSGVDHPIAKVNNPRSKRSHIIFMGHHDDGDSLVAVKRAEQFHYFDAFGRIEISRGFIG